MKIFKFQKFPTQDFRFIIKGLQDLFKTQLITLYFCLSTYITMQTNSTYSLPESRDQCRGLCQYKLQWANFILCYFILKEKYILYIYILMEVFINWSKFYCFTQVHFYWSFCKLYWRLASLWLLYSWDSRLLWYHGQHTQTL